MSRKLFNELLEIAETDNDFTHFQEALSFFEKAQEIRLGKNDQELISETETAIEACRYRLEV